jgi:hypothetical protein
MDPSQQTQSIQAVTSPQQPVSNIPSSGSKLKWILLAIVLLVIACGIACYLGTAKGTIQQSISNQTTITSTATPTTLPMPSTTSKLSIVNSSSGPNNYFRFQIRFPANYFVTSDDMLTDYNSPGDQAPPRLTLTKETQLLADGSYASLLKSNADCIMIWTTIGFDSFDSWENNVYPITINGVTQPNQIQIITTSPIKIGKYDGTIREVKDSTYPQRIEAFVKMPDNKTTYFFNTCNANTKEDLQTILQNFNVRGQP